VNDNQSTGFAQDIRLPIDLGTVPTIDLASRHNDCCAACILHSPLTSGMRVAFPDTKRTWCCDAFPSIDKIHRIKSIILIIHGTEDDVIDVSHGFALYNRIQLQNQIEPLWLDGAGHNDIEVREFRSYGRCLLTWFI
jgi:abhydrolase domain-containing protein 17